MAIDWQRRLTSKIEIRKNHLIIAGEIFLRLTRTEFSGRLEAREGKQWTESRHSVNTICKFHLIGVHLMIILMAILNQFFRFETLCFNETIIMTHRVCNTESLSVCELQTSIHLALSDWPVGPAECIIERYSMSSPVHSPGSWTYSDWYHKKLVGGWR